MLNTAQPTHSDFKGMCLITGNAMTNHQLSGFIRTEGQSVEHGVLDEKGRKYINTSNGRYYGSSVEQIVDFDLRQLNQYLTHSQRQLIKERAINGTKQLVVVLRVFKTVKGRYGDKSQQAKVHGVIVIDHKNNTLLNTWHGVNHYRSIAFVEAMAQQLIAERSSKVRPS